MAWMAFGHDELAAGEVFAGPRQQDGHLQREHVLAVKILVQAVVVAVAVLPGSVASGASARRDGNARGTRPACPDSGRRSRAARSSDRRSAPASGTAHAADRRATAAAGRRSTCTRLGRSRDGPSRPSSDRAPRADTRPPAFALCARQQPGQDGIAIGVERSLDAHPVVQREPAAAIASGHHACSRSSKTRLRSTPQR